tara:strand:+ start:628 stop:810 length:183 start_codon:yes stop_codon:yes gene_type:complete
MPNARDHSKMKLVSAYVSTDFKKKLERIAKARGVSMSDLIRDLLAEEADRIAKKKKQLVN